MNNPHGSAEFDDQHTAVGIWLDKSVYSQSAILKACYWYSRDLWFQLGDEAARWRLTIGLRVTGPTLAQPKVRKIDEWMPDIFNALLDAQLQTEVQAETASIRELIIAKAFAESGVLEESPPGTFEDPVGSLRSKAKGLTQINTNLPR